MAAVEASHCESVPSSFRDPSGAVYLLGDRVFRTVAATEADFVCEFLDSPLGSELIASGALVRTRKVELESVPFKTEAPLVLDHEPVWFPSYAAEWPPEMLHAAAALTLDLLERAIAAGYGLKDATPYNVLFRGPEPQFIDFLSFERRDPGDPQWLAFAQFSRTFLLPLLAYREFGLSLSSTFLQFRDGLEPEQLYAMCSPLQRFKPSMLRLVSLPKWLTGVAESTAETLYATRRVSPDRARFTLERLIHSARKLLNAVCPRDRGSRWTGYVDLPHARIATEAKTAFVVEAVRQGGCTAVLDIGCNTGEYSRAAARAGTRVVAIDFDAEVVGENWRQACREHLDILPLVVNIARPTPSLGWRNQEQSSFLERASGHFDCVLMLGLIHHLLVSERIPLGEIVDLAAQLTTSTLIIEFVPASDPMFRRIARGRDALHSDFTHTAFEGALLKRFEVVNVAPVPGGDRVLYCLRKRIGGLNS